MNPEKAILSDAKTLARKSPRWLSSLLLLSLCFALGSWVYRSNARKLPDQRSLIISQLSTEQLRAKQVSADEQEMAAEYERKAQALRSKNQNQTQPYLKDLEACLDDYLRRLPDPCDPSRFIPSLSLAGLKLSPAPSQPTDSPER